MDSLCRVCVCVVCVCRGGQDSSADICRPQNRRRREMCSCLHRDWQEERRTELALPVSVMFFVFTGVFLFIFAQLQATNKLFPSCFLIKIRFIDLLMCRNFLVTGENRVLLSSYIYN